MGRKKKLDKLSQDMIQCAKDGFGVHYGRWKAAQQPVSITKQPPKGCSTAICEYCGAEYVRRQNRMRKYCGDVCRQNAYFANKQKVKND